MGDAATKATLVDVRSLHVFLLAVLLVPVGRAGNAYGQMLTSLHSFTGGNDGGFPQAGLVQGSDGNFYGTTAGFINLGTGSFGGNTGTVFRISSSGTFTNLYSFTGGSDGSHPQAGLVQGSDGNYYGTTAGFINLGSGSFGGNTGTVFRISSSGAFSNLYSFTGGNDGASPQAGLVQGSDGNFYGTTYGGGAYGVGTVFRISSSGILSNLYSFTDDIDGGFPQAGLVQGIDGNFYGTTYQGGWYGVGTVFRISSSGILSNLYSFTDGIDGAFPQAGLVQGSDSNFYGTTSQGGWYGVGTVFWISSSGILSNLYSFTDGIDGAFPQAGLVQGTDGSFYGTTSGGGANGFGTVFGISYPYGVFSNFYSFADGTDGGTPQAGLVQGSDGNFYGTTYGGGAYGTGTVFKLSANVGPLQINTIVRAGTNIQVGWQWPWSGYTQLQRSSGDAAGNYSNAWVNIGTVMTVGPSTNYTDISSATNRTRYYRVRMTPISP